MISFDAIGKAFGTYRITKYFQKRAQYECAVDIYRKKMSTSILTSTVSASTNEFPEFGAFDDTLLYNELMQPCDDFIIALFTKYVKDRKPIIDNIKANRKIHSVVSIDHTFQAASRTKAYTKSSDG